MDKNINYFSEWPKQVAYEKLMVVLEIIHILFTFICLMLQSLKWMKFETLHLETRYHPSPAQYHPHSEAWRGQQHAVAVFYTETLTVHIQHD